MADYPMTFAASCHSSFGIETSWAATTGERRTIECSIPKEFAGPSSGFSPEDLFVLALMNCYVATLKVIAANSKIHFESIEGGATLILDRDAGSPTPWMKRAELSFTLRGVENKERAGRLMERVARQCLILNSVKTEISFQLNAVEK